MGETSESRKEESKDTYIKKVEETQVKIETRTEPSFWLDVCSGIHHTDSPNSAVAGLCRRPVLLS